MRVLVTGPSSSVGQRFIDRVRSAHPHAEIVRLGRGDEVELRADLADLDAVDALSAEIRRANRILLCHGLLRAKDFLGQRPVEIAEGLCVNLSATIRIIEHALIGNPGTRIAVIGSESGFKGSHDMAYALSKAALHAYVRWRRMAHAEQQLVCIAPSMIEDAGMTTRRSDLSRVAARALQHPKGRLLTSNEVAALAYFLLFEDKGYTTNAVIAMDGGKFAF